MAEGRGQPRRPFNFLKALCGAWGVTFKSTHQAGDDPRASFVAEAGKIGAGHREEDLEE